MTSEWNKNIKDIASDSKVNRCLRWVYDSQESIQTKRFLDIYIHGDGGRGP